MCQLGVRFPLSAPINQLRIYQVNLVKKIFRALNGSEWAEKVIAEYEKVFPDRCVICGYYRYGFSHGLLKSTEIIPDHVCKEKINKNEKNY